MDKKKPNPARSQSGVKALLAKSYDAVYALTDGGDGDLEIQANLARLEAVLKADSEVDS